MENKIIENSLQKALSYEAYMELVKQLASEGKTSGPEQTDVRINFTKLNMSRMRRLNKTLAIPEKAVKSFKRINKRQTWLVIMESWCADGAQTIPVLNKICEEVTNLDLRIVLRDENPELMDLFLTSGTRSIPKLIVLDGDVNVVHTWGPRSGTVMNMVAAYKSQNGKIDDPFKEFLQIWYNRDGGMAIIEDLVKLVEETPLAEKR
ncbi:thioredoxin family protein [Sinomicrobium pectinilyticum]|uniref:Thioredoxin family protein n=1 Tax=Sinomicrobium pectinilyticum TaxID=1084421 RepID=A0A3N0DP14_SINP1|nr:thioredoxin family protein [Sinomicrobium pectinilyticum]RNL77397.1 thioredoxin family protein [Sinomicrobium pectinilyticum]